MVVPTPTLRRKAAAITRRNIRTVRRAALMPLVPALLAVLPASAGQAASAPTLDKSKLLWATINICDTVKHPDTIGIRASMPGSGKKAEKMYMRFQVQYFRASTQKWAPTDATVDSGFQSVGSALFRRRESGWNFSITPPPAGQTSRLRGIVSFEWRAGKKVAHKAQQRSHWGHTAPFGAAPRGSSAAECIIKP